MSTRDRMGTSYGLGLDAKLNGYLRLETNQIIPRCRGYIANGTLLLVQ